jgi:hypothetical protein
MKKDCLYLFFVLNIGCNSATKSELHYFSKYEAAESNLITENEFILSIDRTHFVNTLSYKKDSQLITFKEKQQDSGIYRKMENDSQTYQLTHPFYLLDTAFLYLENHLVEKFPLLNGRVRYKEKKVYVINQDSFKILAFSESWRTNPKSIWSYYLVGFGFINYYSNELDCYYSCDSTRNSSVSPQTLHQLKVLLLSDTTFFARHLYDKMNYYRAKGNE